ncbi:hypothetical protein IAR55_003975 [Kwoniella newhampshirensis]|uniref:F-box domain-containing protein n=1 Tax=Kwoniella newhampshirensis TaxID=1651941 RepID=A0AAW0YL59_9TREE
MPQNLLDLSDETLLLISHFVHKDNEIELPSFGAHWENFQSDIDPEVAEDYLSFRSSCKRLYKICKLQGLHVRVKRWNKMVKWVEEAPVAVMRGVRRVELDIVRDSVPQVSFSLRSSMISTFLSGFTNLEELIVTNLPLCRHTRKGYKTHHLRALYDFLKNLLSLCVQVKCDQCSTFIPLWMLSASPILQHLKVADGGFTPSESSGNSNWLLQKILEVYSMRNGCPIRSLYLGTFWGNEAILPVISNFPLIENLQVLQYNEKNLAHSQLVCLPCKDNILSVSDYTGEQSLRSFADQLRDLRSLKTLDCHLVISPRPEFEPTTLDMYDRRSHYSAVEGTPNRSRRALEYRTDVQRILEATAQALTDALPSLQYGAVWQDMDDTVHQHCFRWTFEVQGEQGNRTPVFDPVPVAIPRIFSANYDATCLAKDAEAD